MRFEEKNIALVGGRPGIDRIWFARSGKWTFIIDLTKGVGGYRASWKNREFIGKQPANFIEGEPFETFTAAEAACLDTLKKLKSAA